MNIEPLEARIAPATFVVNLLTDVTADDGLTTLREAIVAANATPAADTILFAPALAGTLTLTGGQIDITETLAILGGGKITISGNSASRIFNVDNPDTARDHPLTVSGLKFIKGKSAAAEAGGAIRSLEGLAVLDCTFDGNVASSQGGAISVNAGKGAVTIKNSHFTDNTSGTFGGAVLARSAKAVTLSGSVFADNTAVGGGGAYLLADAVSAKIAVTGCVFSGNSAQTGAAGALWIDGNDSDSRSSKVSLVTSRFLDNDAATDGGGLFLRSGAVSLSGVIVSGNTAAGGGGGLDAFAVRKLTVTKSLFADNRAVAGGGGIYLTGAAAGFSASITATQIVDNEVKNGGTPSGRGGGVYALETGGKINITGSLISANSAANGGGITIYQNAAPGVIATLTGNTVSGNETSGGGAGMLLTRDGDFFLTKNTISGNHAGGNGAGGVEFDTRGKLVLKDNRVMGNRSESGTGGLRLVIATGSSVSESGNTIVHNEGGTTGGLAIGSSVEVTIAKKTKISGNIARTASGAGGVTNGSDGPVNLLGSVLGNYNAADSTFDQVKGTFATGPAPAPGAVGNLVVTTLADSGDGSLRQAVEMANASPGADKISFDPDLKGVLTLTTGEIEVTAPLTIFGGGRITLSGNNASRIFFVSNNLASDAPLTVNGLTFTKGNDFSGGAIFSYESLNAVDCLFVDNVATSSAAARCWSPRRRAKSRSPTRTSPTTPAAMAAGCGPPPAARSAFRGAPSLETPARTAAARACSSSPRGNSASRRVSLRGTSRPSGKGAGWRSPGRPMGRSSRRPRSWPRVSSAIPPRPTAALSR